MTRGKLIVFEGLDRAGKSTQCQMLAEALQKDGVKVRHMRFPGMCNELNSPRRRIELEDCDLSSIQADITAGTTVIIDRYYYSGAVYSAAKNKPNLSLEWCRKPDEGLPRPDVCIFLDISAEDAAKRGGYGTEKYEKKDMQDRVRELFETLMQRKEGEDLRGG
ncbi:Nn.00g082170.m01.CDS01 [Neocucurbitaria sp. VM-36]